MRKAKSAFGISKFRNPSGEIVYRVQGVLHGQRIRKNFPSRTEAEAERDLLDVQRLQNPAKPDDGVRVAATCLNDAQLREAESVFNRLAGQKRPLTFFVEFALANYQEPESQKLITDAVADYIKAKEHEFQQDHISRSQMQRIRMDLKKLQLHFPEKSVAELTVASLVAFFELGRPSLKTYNNRRGIVGTFLKFCFHRGWIEENPVLKVPQHRIRRRRGMATTFTAAQARTLMERMETYDGGRWVPYFALCLFAGIRPGVPDGEITKLRPEAVNLDTNTISITADVSKVREPRSIVIQPNLAAWLRAYPLEKLPIIVGNFKRRRQKFKDELKLTHDVLRHTFISMFVAKFRSIGEAAIQAGNSESIIRKHYLDVKTAAEAEDFWSIRPQRTLADNVVAMPAQPRLLVAS